MKSLSRVQLFATPWTATYQAPPSMGFSRQEYWSGVPLPSPHSALLLLLLLLSRFSRVRLCATPSLGFSRQGHWSGLPFPPPHSTLSSVQFSRSVVSDSLRPHESQHARPPCPSPTPGVYPNSCPSSSLAWKIPWMEEPGRLQSMGLRRVGHD